MQDDLEIKERGGGQKCLTPNLYESNGSTRTIVLHSGEVRDGLTLPIITLFIEDCVFFLTDALLVFSIIARSSRAASKSERRTSG
jgi:hypothetical protein